MKDSFEDAASFYFQIDEIGSASIEVLTDAQRHEFDKVNFVTIDREPFLMGMVLVENDGDQEFIPKSVFPINSVVEINNDISDVEPVNEN